MILRNHGVLTAGRTIAEAFVLMFYVEKACEAQILAQSTGSALIMPPEAICKQSMLAQSGDNLGQLQWQALMRSPCHPRPRQPLSQYPWDALSPASSVDC